MSEEKDNSFIETIKLIATIATIISVITFLSKLFGKSKGEEERDQIDTGAAASRKKLYTQIPPSFSDHVYSDWADILDKAILRDATESEDAVYSVFQEMKNISDVYKTIDAFAHRREMFTTYEISLPQAIHTLFNKAEKTKLNYILFKKKINYKFR